MIDCVTTNSPYNEVRYTKFYYILIFNFNLIYRQVLVFLYSIYTLHIYIFTFSISTLFFNFVCNSAFEQGHLEPRRYRTVLIILEWTTSLDTSSRTLFVREDVSPDVHVTSNVKLRNNVRLLLNVELRNYIISRQIVERRVT